MVAAMKKSPTFHTSAGSFNFQTYVWYLPLSTNIYSTPEDVESNTWCMFIFFLLQITSAESSQYPQNSCQLGIFKFNRCPLNFV